MTLLAYWHAGHLTGLIPCKVIGRTPGGGLRVQLSADSRNGAYKRGEVVGDAYGDVWARPLRRSRQRAGAVYSRTLTADEVAHLPLVSTV